MLLNENRFVCMENTRIGYFCAKNCNKSLNLACFSPCFKGFITCLGLSQLTISCSVLIVLLLTVEVKSNLVPDVAIDMYSDSLAPNHVSDESRIQLLEHSHSTKLIIENSLTTRTKNILTHSIQCVAFVT